MTKDDIPEDVTAKDCTTYFPCIVAARVIKVYDADTVTVACRCAGQDGLFKISLRLMGVDTPEMTSKDPRLKEKAYAARDALRERIMGKSVRVEVVPIKEKYGRTLAQLFIGEEHVNEWLVTSGHANRYDGNTKADFD